MAGKIPQPWLPAPYEAVDVYAIQALAEGKANEGQQKRVLQWLIEKACGTYDETYMPDSERNTAYAQGKRHVGLQIVKLLKIPASSIEAKRRG